MCCITIKCFKIYQIMVTGKQRKNCADCLACKEIKFSHPTVDVT